VCFFLNGDPM